MADTKIEWAEKVWNPVTGCTPISEGCANCYAQRMAQRLKGRCGYPEDDPFRVTVHMNRLNDPGHWTKPQRIFVCSMADLFHEDVPFSHIHWVWDAMKACPQHTFVVLTKRPQRMKEVVDRIYSLERLGNAMGFWTHVWLGVTAENQARADERIPILLQIPAAVRFVSVEPMLGPVDLVNIQTGTHWINALNGNSQYVSGLGPMLDWVICGGESGPGARPMHPDWARSLRDQCRAAGLPFMFKQWGEWEVAEGEELGRCGIEDRYPGKAYQYIDCQECGIGQDAYGNVDESVWNRWFVRTGKKAAGRLLDGQVWDQYPGVNP